MRMTLRSVGWTVIVGIRKQRGRRVCAGVAKAGSGLRCGVRGDEEDCVAWVQSHPSVVNV